MGTQRVIQIDAGGKPAKVVVTEVTPGRWAWVVRIDGEPSLSSRSPSPTGQAAINCALLEFRALSGVATARVSPLAATPLMPG